MSISIESSSAEPALVTVATTTDPTGTPPDFQLSALTVTTPVGSWVAGTWTTTWAAGKVTAQTPTIGAAGALVIVEGSRYNLWMRWGSVVKLATTVIAT
jgi:hypothetical protein